MARARAIVGLATLALGLVSACATNPTRRCAGDDGCQASDVCYRGFCIAGGPADAARSDAAMSCPMGQTLCDHCYNLQTDHNHCGTCDTECHSPTGNCAFGRCVPD